MQFSSQEFANFVGISKKSVQNYREQGMPSIKKNKYYYYTFEAIQWLYDNGIKDVAGSSNEELTPKYRKDLAEAKLKEHALGVKEKKYVLRETVYEEQFKIARMVRDSFLNISRITSRLVGKNEHEMKIIINKEVHMILSNLSD